MSLSTDFFYSSVGSTHWKWLRRSWRWWECRLLLLLLTVDAYYDNNKNEEEDCCFEDDEDDDSSSSSSSQQQLLLVVVFSSSESSSSSSVFSVGKENERETKEEKFNCFTTKKTRREGGILFPDALLRSEETRETKGVGDFWERLLSLSLSLSLSQRRGGHVSHLLMKIHLVRVFKIFSLCVDAFEKKKLKKKKLKKNSSSRAFLFLLLRLLLLNPFCCSEHLSRPPLNRRRGGFF